MMLAVDYSDWGYHTLGECLDVLFYEDPDVVAKLHIAIKLMLKDADDPMYVVRAATVALSHARDKRKELSSLMQDFPALTDHECFQDISVAVQGSGEYSLYI